MIFYERFPEWWPLFSPAHDYADEAIDLLKRLGPSPRRRTLLELGCGGGSLASHLARDFDLTLTELAPGMLAQARALIPHAEHIVGDMRTLRLDRRFDVVLLHDAVAYMTTEDDLRAALATIASHCRPDGVAAVLPDFVRETYEPETEHGGEDSEDGRGFRYLAWSYDPDPDDSTYVVDHAFLMRHADGRAEVAHDRHIEGLFSRETWLRLFRDAGLDANSEIDPWGRDVFIARPRP